MQKIRPDMDIVLPGNIKYGDSLEAIKSALGEPTKIDTTDDQTTIKYIDETQRRHYVELSLWKDKLKSFSLYVNNI